MTAERPLDRHFQPALDEARTAATWKRIAARRWPARRMRRAWLIAAASAAVLVASAIAIVIVTLAWPGAPHPAPLTCGDASVSVAPGTVWTDPGHELVLDDESRVALALDARLEILANEGTRFATLLQAGSAHFDVHPGGPRRWEIETALASVEVVGTAFTVALRDGQLEVGVERGVVLVHGELVPGRVARLTAGQRIVVGPARLVPTVANAPDEVSPHADTAPAPPAHTDIAPRAAPAPPQPPTAPAAVESVADMIAEADQLTSSGDPAGAVKLLEHARTRGSARESGLVAFTLGRLYLDALDKPALAAAAFDEVITRASPHSLLEDAYARRTEALIRAGARDRAAISLAAYAHAYPQGRRLAALRTLMKAP